MKKRTLKHELKNQMGAVLGAFIYSVGINLFIVPLGLYSGGTMGVCQLLRTFFLWATGFEMSNMDIAGIIYYIINVPIFVLGIRKLGKHFMAGTIITVSVMSLLLSVIPIADKGIMGDDLLASCAIGGIVTGAGIGFVLKNASTMGGMDIVSLMVMKKYKNISMGKVYLAVNIIVYGICLILYEPQIAIYSLIYSVLCSVTMDKVYTQNIITQAIIVSKNNAKEIEESIIKDMVRGVTVWRGNGAYTGEEETVMMTALSKYEIPMLKRIVHKKDPTAFVVLQEGVFVDGSFEKRLF
ncbi:MAG: YitT family protein [Eubacterium sp.]